MFFEGQYCGLIHIGEPSKSLDVDVREMILDTGRGGMRLRGCIGSVDSGPFLLVIRGVAWARTQQVASL